jgi:PRTRC genetic system ThiF family protein
MKPYLDYLNQLRLYLYRQSLNQLGRLGQRLQTLAESAPGGQTLSLQRSYRLDIGHPDRVVIFLIGCGGTGSHTGPILAQLAVWAQSAGIDLRLYFVDDDRIEEKNLVRQNFCQAEIGYPKAFSLAWRYTAAFGLTITPVVERFSAELLDRYKPSYSPQGTLTIVVGAVDNVHARRDMAEAITAKLRTQPNPRDKLFWLDAGNERLSGQVLAGNSLEPEPLLSPLGYCVGIPLPHLQEPSLLMERERPVDEVDLSCADLTLLAEQSAMINRAMATWLGVYLYRLLQSRDLDMMATYLSLRGATRSTLITHGRLVRPERPQTQRPADGHGTRPDEEEPPQEDVCPECGGELIAGQDEWRGVLIGVRFCEACSFREEGCPECGGELDEDVVQIDGAVVPVVRCWDCTWQEPIPVNAH